MRKSEARFCQGVELSRAIREICRGAKPRCAVAFWGNGAAREIFGHRSARYQNAQIICDISMGGTSASELETLGAPTAANVRYVNYLHTKLYLSSNGGVAGSANASDNGVGFIDEPAKLVECGVHFGSDTEIYAAASEWFDEIWKLRARQVNVAALERARLSFGKRARAAIITSPARRGKTVIDLVKESPEMFEGFGFIVTSVRTSKAQREDNVARDIPDYPGLSLEQYEQFTEWAPRLVSRWPEDFVNLHVSNGQCVVTVYRRVAVAPQKRPTRVYAEVKRTGAIRNLLFRRERPQASQILKPIGGHGFFSTAEEFIDGLDFATG